MRVFLRVIMKGTIRMNMRVTIRMTMRVTIGVSTVHANDHDQLIFSVPILDYCFLKS